MNDHVFWILEADIKAGQLDKLQALMREMVEGTQRDEPGALNYEWFIADDGKSLHLYERYADPDAVMVHRGNFAQKYRERFLTCVTMTKMTLYGNLNSEIRAAFATSANPVYMSMAHGFARQRLLGFFAVHNAYRCADGNLLRDPCFADPTRDDAGLCVGDPFSRGVVRLRVSADLDRSGSAPSSLVWAVRLANCQRCTFFAGGATSADSAGRRANYGCSGRHTILWGNPVRRGHTWRIRLSHSFTPGPERLAAIRTAYIGLG